MTHDAPFHPRLLAPRHWPAWIGLGAIWLIARIPYRALLALGRFLGAISTRLLDERRRVAARNIALCFPELDEAARSRLLDENLRDGGVMLAEFALAWMGSS